MRSPLNELFELWLVSLRSLASGLEGCTTGDEQSLLATIATMSRERFARSSCYIISGISGSGKTSLGLELEARIPQNSQRGNASAQAGRTGQRLRFC